MTHGQSSTPRRRLVPGIVVAGLLVVIAANAPALGHQSPASSSATAATPGGFGRSDDGAASSTITAPASGIFRGDEPGAPAEIVAPPLDVLRGDGRGALGVADGVIPDGTTVFDDTIPGVARLDPALLGALRRAATDAAGDGVEFHVDSGWRSPAYQEQLLRQAVANYGSEAGAARWVATPTTSAHVSGEAVDIGRVDATAWLSRRGAAYGLCQIYGNEPWHYELRPEAIDRGCPPMYADPTHDPRMQR